MAVPKKKSSKTRTNRRYRTWVKKEQKRLVNGLVLVPYGRGGELKPAHIYLDDGGDLRKHKKPVKAAPEKEEKADSKAKKKPEKDQDLPAKPKKAPAAKPAKPKK